MGVVRATVVPPFEGRLILHGERGRDRGPRIVCALLHAGLAGASFWILGGGGSGAMWAWLGLPPFVAGDPARRALLIVFGVVLFIRMAVGLFLVLERKFGWDELAGVVIALAVYQVGFAWLGVREASPLGAVDIVAAAVFVVGSMLNTGSELQRRAFKRRPENRGRLFTGGLFRLVRHPNYSGDILWVAAWAAVTRSPWALLIPAALTAAFVGLFIPQLERYLAARYGSQFTTWKRTTHALVPYLF